jgi:hypothetical protein
MATSLMAEIMLSDTFRRDYEQFIDLNHMFPLVVNNEKKRFNVDNGMDEG